MDNVLPHVGSFNTNMYPWQTLVGYVPIQPQIIFLKTSILSLSSMQRSCSQSTRKFKLYQSNTWMGSSQSFFLLGGQGFYGFQRSQLPQPALRWFSWMGVTLPYSSLPRIVKQKSISPGIHTHVPREESRTLSAKIWKAIGDRMSCVLKEALCPSSFSSEIWVGHMPPRIKATFPHHPYN